ncbi:MAG: tyrosine-protein phosphatase [Nonomuraea sp.]|nr:tyrosine-protein phosphatase [Nonomuraea sp.]
MPLLNLRDVAAEAPIRPGLLYRSAQPYLLTPEDLALVGGLRLVADLRGSAERAVHDWPGDLATVSRLGVDEAGSPAALPPAMDLGALYVLMLDHRADWFAAVVAELADGLPALVHCAAGKDRTGIVVALVLDLLGVDHETIVRDYARSADHLPAVARMLNLPADLPAVLLEAPPEAMRTFLAALSERGGAEKVLLTHGLTTAHTDSLRAALLSPGR